jgi:hypothetical protein
MVRLAFGLIALVALGIAGTARGQDAPVEAPATATPDPTTPAPQTPAAQTPEVADAAQARARDLFQEGVALTRTERWAEALARFRESAAIVERPSTLLNIATALQRLGRARECIAAVDRYFLIAPETDAAPRAQAAALRAAMQQSLGHVSLAVLPEDAEVLVDGEPVDARYVRSLTLDPGSHAFLVQREGHLPARFTLELAPGASASRAVSLVARPAEPARLSVSTQVVGARIEVDGDVVGTDEADLELLPGAHVVRVVANGWDTFERSVSIEAGTRQRIDAQLSRPGACQSVECEPAFWIVGGLIVAGAAAAAIALPLALATEAPPYGGTANFHVDALRF